MTGLFLLSTPITAPTPTPLRPRTNVYIDGYNFYYGAVKDTPHKWLNFWRLLRILRPNDDISKIYYFTALVDGSHRPRQQAYLAALSTLPDVEIVLGKFLHKGVTCRVGACTATCHRVFSTPEEKRTDVNIAIQMLDDAYQDACDQLLLVSGDSDLVPAVQTVKKRFPEKKILVYVPSRGRSGKAYELKASADQAKEFPLNLLPKAQFPAQITTSAGVVISKPAEW